MGRRGRIDELKKKHFQMCPALAFISIMSCYVRVKAEKCYIQPFYDLRGLLGLARVQQANKNFQVYLVCLSGTLWASYVIRHSFTFVFQGWSIAIITKTILHELILLCGLIFLIMSYFSFLGLLKFFNDNSSAGYSCFDSKPI